MNAKSQAENIAAAWRFRAILATTVGPADDLQFPSPEAGEPEPCEDERDAADGWKEEL